MKIIGFENSTETQETDLKTLLCRESWQLLQTFGYIEDHKIQIGSEYSLFDTEDEMEGFEAVETEYINYGKYNEYAVVLNQYPFFEGKMCSDIGYVAMHLCEYDKNEEVENTQQIVFRQEIHPDGVEVFYGDEHYLTIVDGLSDLIQVGTFLQYVKSVAWPGYCANPSSLINIMPQSELMTSINTLLYPDDEDI